MQFTQHGILGSRPRQAPGPWGNFLTDTYDRAALGGSYTVLGSGFSTNSSDLLITGGTGVMTNRMRFNRSHTNDGGHSFENWVMEARIKLTSTKSATTYGIMIGVSDFGVPDGIRNIMGHFYMTTSAGTGGKVLIRTYDETTLATVATSAGQLTWATGDWIVVRLEKALTPTASRFTLTATKESDSSTVSTTWDEPGYPQTDYPYSTGQFAIYNIGGDITVDTWTIDVTDIKHCHDLFIGDSITHGRYSTDFTTRWAANISSDYSISAGSGDVTQRVLDKIGNVIEYDPVRVFLMIGGNDILLGVAQATYRANYELIRNKLIAAGIEVVHCLATPRTPTDITALNTWISATFTSDLVIDTYTPLKGAGTTLSATYDTGDGVHPNQAGHDLIASTILAAL